MHLITFIICILTHTYVTYTYVCMHICIHMAIYSSLQYHLYIHTYINNFSFICSMKMYLTHTECNFILFYIETYIFLQGLGKICLRTYIFTYVWICLYVFMQQRCRLVKFFVTSEYLLKPRDVCILINQLNNLE